MRVGALQRSERRLSALADERTGELIEARNHAEEANKSKSAFLANMSHELRTPLNAILGFSTLLRESGVSGEQRDQVDIINRSGEHLLSLINDVLDVAKIEAGRQALAIAPCDLISTVRDVVEMMQVRARAKNLALLCQDAPDFPQYVRMDAAKLRQILINLLGNAVKFTNQGTVTLRLSSAAADEEQVRIRFGACSTWNPALRRIWPSTIAQPRSAALAAAVDPGSPVESRSQDDISTLNPSHHTSVRTERGDLTALTPLSQ